MSFSEKALDDQFKLKKQTLQSLYSPKDKQFIQPYIETEKKLQTDIAGVMPKILVVFGIAPLLTAAAGVHYFKNIKKHLVVHKRELFASYFAGWPISIIYGKFALDGVIKKPEYAMMTEDHARKLLNDDEVEKLKDFKNLAGFIAGYARHGEEAITEINSTLMNLEMNLDMNKRSSLREKLIEILEENDATTMTNFRSNFEGTIAQLVGDVLKQNPIANNEQLSNVTAFESSKYEEGENITNQELEQNEQNR